jgi:hypothetical protein
LFFLREVLVFFESLDGDLIPIGRVECVEKETPSGDIPRWLVRLTGGESVYVGLSGKRDLENIQLPSFAAAVGTYVLRVDDGQLFRSAVVGWAVGRSGHPMPITIDGINDGDDLEEYVSVLLPDGLVYRPDDGVRTLDEFERENGVVDVVITLDADTPGLAEMIEATNRTKAEEPLLA